MLFTENLFVEGKAPGMELYHKMAVQGFFSTSWGRWTGDPPQEDLDKSGYRSERKVIFFETLLCTCDLPIV
jgi:hypothetical protein